MEDHTTSKNTDNTKTILIIIIIILLGIIGFLLFNNSRKTETIASKDQKIQKDSSTISAKIKELEDLQTAYERIKLDREALGLSNDSLNQEVAKLNEYITEVKKERSANSVKIRQLDAIIAKIKADLDARDAEITTLRAQNDTLKTNVEVLTKEKTSLSDTISSLTNRKTELEEKVAIASVLKAENIRVSVINPKGKELNKDEYKAKNIDKLKVTFHLGENRVARKDKKNIYLKLIQPDASTLFDLSTGGGFFIADGKEVPYTVKQEVDFDNNRQNVTFIYVKGSPYTTGKYTIELYHDNNKIGEVPLIVK
jgi:hypothetical protein